MAACPPEILAQGCAMCRTALEGQEADPLTQAFNVSALFLIATPYTVVATFGLWIAIATRRRHRRPPHDDLAEVPLQ